MSTGPRFGWEGHGRGSGGRRPGAGRKRRIFSATDQQIRTMLREAKRMAKEQGKTLDRLLLELIYDEENDKRNRVTAIKIFKEFTMPRQTEQNVNIRQESKGPAIVLPEMMPDPAKEKFPKEGNA